MASPNPGPMAREFALTSSTSRRAKAIWNILAQSGLGTHVVAWYASHPAEPVNGVIISNHYPVAPQPGEPWEVAEGTIHPPELTDALARLRIRPEELKSAELQSFIPHAAAVEPCQADRLLKCTVILAETATTHAAATWAMEHRPWEFMAILYDSVDHFSHMFMDCHPPKQRHISEEDFEKYRHVIEMCYHFHDLMLGRLLELAGDETTVLLVSDHGFRSTSTSRHAQNVGRPFTLASARGRLRDAWAGDSPRSAAQRRLIVGRDAHNPSIVRPASRERYGRPALAGSFWKKARNRSRSLAGTMFLARPACIRPTFVKIRTIHCTSCGTSSTSVILSRPAPMFKKQWSSALKPISTTWAAPCSMPASLTVPKRC